MGEVTLTSGRTAQYYVDAKRAILRPAGFRALGELVAAEAVARSATAVGGLTMGADPVACAALAVPSGAGLKAFFVRKERKEHGLERWIEGPALTAGERCLVVEDVVTTGGSTIRAIERVREEGHVVAGVVSVLDRLAGGGDAIEAAAERRTSRSRRSTTSTRSGPTARREPAGTRPRAVWRRPRSRSGSDGSRPAPSAPRAGG